MKLRASHELQDSASALDFGPCWTLGLVRVASARISASCCPPNPPPPPPQDPLMSLMMSQPKIELAAVPKATAAFDPPVVRPGEQAFYRVMFNALEESIEWPDKIAAPPQLEIRPGAHGQILQMTGTNMEPRTSFNYRVRASSLGIVHRARVCGQGRWQTGDRAGRAARGRFRAACHRAARAAAHARVCPPPTCLSARRCGAHRVARAPRGRGARSGRSPS